MGALAPPLGLSAHSPPEDIWEKKNGVGSIGLDRFGVRCGTHRKQGQAASGVSVRGRHSLANTWAASDSAASGVICWSSARRRSRVLTFA